MKREIVPGVYEVGARDKDRTLFDEIVPLPNGTSYNAYLVQGFNKTALIDNVDPEKVDILLNNIKDTKIDYIIANHAEQDHSGSLPLLLKQYPEAIVITNQKCADLLQTHLHIQKEKIQIIQDNETLDLGYKNLKFILTPWVHWPETMCTYLEEEQILFSCDFFGSHIASEELYVEDEKLAVDATKRYYAEIMMPFRLQIKNNIEKLSQFPIKIIAPSHGQLHNNPQYIIDEYKDWISDNTKNKVVITYVSMHESTRLIAQYIKQQLENNNIETKIFNATNVDVGELTSEMVDAKVLLFATPAFLTGIHPQMANILFLTNAIKPKAKFVGITGSFGWGQQIEKQVQALMPRLNPQYLTTTLTKGKPTKDSYQEYDKLVEEIKSKLD